MSLLTSVLKRLSADRNSSCDQQQENSDKPQSKAKAASQAKREETKKTSNADLNKLESLLTSRQLLEAQHRHVKTDMQTMILDINHTEGYLLLDDLFPAPEGISLKEGHTLTLRHHCEGHWQQFKVTVLHRSTSNGSPFYVVSLPEHIESLPRRRSERAQFDSSELITAKVTSPSRTPWHAAINDISAGGISLVVGGNVLDQLSRDSIIPRCHIELAPGIIIDAPIQVKHYRFQRKPLRQTTVSGQFINLTPQQHNQISSYIEARLFPDHAAA